MGLMKKTQGVVACNDSACDDLLIWTDGSNFQFNPSVHGAVASGAANSFNCFKGLFMNNHPNHPKLESANCQEPRYFVCQSPGSSYPCVASTYQYSNKVGKHFKVKEIEIRQTKSNLKFGLLVPVSPRARDGRGRQVNLRGGRSETAKSEEPGLAGSAGRVLRRLRGGALARPVQRRFRVRLHGRRLRRPPQLGRRRQICLRFVLSWQSKGSQRIGVLQVHEFQWDQ